MNLVLLLGDTVAALRSLEGADLDLVVAQIGDPKTAQRLKAEWEPMFETEGERRTSLMLISPGTIEEWCEEFVMCSGRRVSARIVFAEPAGFWNSSRAKSERSRMELVLRRLGAL